MNRLETDALEQCMKLPSFNLIPLMLLGSALSISLNLSALWFVALLMLTVGFFLLDYHSFGLALSRVFAVLTCIMLFFLYSTVVRDNQSSTASSYNIASWALILLLMAILHQRYGRYYFEQGAQQLGLVLLALGIFGVIEGILNYNPLVKVFPHILGSWRMGNESYRASAIFSHPIPFAHMMLVGIVLYIFMIKIKLIKKAAAILIFLLAIIESQTRSALLIALAILLCLAFRWTVFGRSRKFSPLVVLLCCIIGLALLLSLSSGVGLSIASGLIDRISSLGGNDVSITQRSGAIELVFSEVLSRGPLEFFIGNGIASSNDLIIGTTISIENFNTVDNNWLTVLFDFGIFAFVLIICLSLRGFYLFILSADRLEACFGAIVTISSLYMFFYSFTMWKSTIFILLLSYYVICFVGQRTVRAVPEASSSLVRNGGLGSDKLLQDSTRSDMCRS